MMIPRIPTEIINMLAHVPRERQIMTTDGVVYDGIRYRFAPEQTTRALSANHHRMPHRFRLKGTAKIHVSIRCWDGNIDRIQVIDDDTGEGFTMWSTNPGYTGGLSRWEHHQYQEMMRKRLGPGQVNLSQNDVEREIMATKAGFLSQFDERRPKMSLQESGIPTALVECEEHRQAILKEAPTGTHNNNQSRRAGSVDPERAGDVVKETQYELFCDAGATFHGGEAGKLAGRVVAGQDREDEPKPPKQPARHKSGKALPEAPPREEGFGTFSTADLTRPAEHAEAEDEDHYEGLSPDVEDDRDDRRGRNLWPDAE